MIEWIGVVTIQGPTTLHSSGDSLQPVLGNSYRDSFDQWSPNRFALVSMGSRTRTTNFNALLRKRIACAGNPSHLRGELGVKITWLDRCFRRGCCCCWQTRRPCGSCVRQRDHAEDDRDARWFASYGFRARFLQFRGKKVLDWGKPQRDEFWMFLLEALDYGTSSEAGRRDNDQKKQMEWRFCFAL